MTTDTIILAMESSCDETAVAVIKNGHEILSNVVSTQIEIHRRYGGVVPEIASRKHLELINIVIQEALDQANITLDDVTHIAVTYGPGLVGALLVGVATAKALAFASGKPLIGVHHIEGHICRDIRRSHKYYSQRKTSEMFVVSYSSSSAISSSSVR